MTFMFSGHPIINDPIYNSPAFGPNRGKDGEYGKTVEQVKFSNPYAGSE
jgi:23S rRNA-/tRNA-specific pseudouridylate synthase